MYVIRLMVAVANMVLIAAWIENGEATFAWVATLCSTLLASEAVYIVHRMVRYGMAFGVSGGFCLVAFVWGETANFKWMSAWALLASIILTTLVIVNPRLKPEGTKA